MSGYPAMTITGIFFFWGKKESKENAELQQQLVSKTMKKVIYFGMKYNPIPLETVPLGFGIILVEVF